MARTHRRLAPRAHGSGLLRPSAGSALILVAMVVLAVVVPVVVAAVPGDAGSTEDRVAPRRAVRGAPPISQPTVAPTGTAVAATPSPAGGGSADGSMPADWRYWVGTLGFGGIAGWSVGYTVKKIAKTAALILGLGFIIVQGLAYNQFITVDWSKIENKVGTGSFDHMYQVLMTVMTYNLPFAGTFVVGFFVGFSRG